jgi:hypothetical protein
MVIPKSLVAAFLIHEGNMKKWNFYANPPRCTCRETFKRYTDSDSHKFLLDKMKSIRGWTLGQLYNTRSYTDHLYTERNYGVTRWFTPRDDDFED